MLGLVPQHLHPFSIEFFNAFLLAIRFIRLSSPVFYPIDFSVIYLFFKEINGQL